MKISNNAKQMDIIANFLFTAGILLFNVIIIIYKAEMAAIIL